jgi:drug/metabolite transporter (DMT)-like permease
MKKNAAILALIAAQVFSGVNTPIIKGVIGRMSPFTFGLLRVGISFVIMAAVFLLVKKTSKPAKRRKKRPTRRDYLMVAIGTFLIYCGANLAFYMGINQTSSINASIILLLWPLIFFMANVEVLKERFSKRTFAGIGLAFIGAAIAVGWPLLGTASSTSTSLVGVLLIFTCIILDVIGTLIVKRVLQRVDGLTTLVIGLGVATVFYFFMALPHLNELALLAEPAVRNAILYGSIMVGCVGYMLGYYGLKTTQGGDYSVISYIQPIAGIIAATILLNESFTPSLLLGTFGVFMGLYLVEARKLPHVHAHGAHR